MKFGGEEHNTLEKQKEASNVCKNMYNDRYDLGGFSSDLINSYAWDTAIIFIQNFAKENYYAYNAGGDIYYLVTYEDDEYLNINDMSTHCFEWTTETTTSNDNGTVYRGGSFSRFDNDWVQGYTYNRNEYWDLSEAPACFAYRPILYVASEK